jgi:hypothetical protein
MTVLDDTCQYCEDAYNLLDVALDTVQATRHPQGIESLCVTWRWIQFRPQGIHKVLKAFV